MDNSDFDKKYSKLTDELDLALREQKKINEQTEKYREELNLNIRNQQILSDKIDETGAKLEKINALKEKDGYLTQEEQKQYDKLNATMDRLLSQNDRLSLQHDNIAQKIDNQSISYDKSKIKVEKIRDKLNELELEQDRINSKGFKETNLDLDNVGKKLSDTISKVGKWSLAIFGIRSAYSMITRAISTVSQYNDDVANKVESIKYTLAMVLEPIITKIVNLVYTLIQYVNYLAKAWFGVNLFANATEKAINKANKNAKDMKKSMAGFDTANVLNDNGGTNGTNTGLGYIPELKDQDVPSWLKWMAENKDLFLEIAGYILLIAGYIQLLKLGLDGITALGLITLITGIIMLIQDVIKYLDDPSWENFGNIIRDIGLAVIGLGIIFGNLPLIIAGVIILIVGLLIKYWDEIKVFFQEKVIAWLDKKIDKLRENGHNFLADILMTIRDFIKTALLVLDQLFTGFKQIFDGIINIANGNFKEGLKQAFYGIGNILIGILNSVIAGINLFIQPFASIIAKLAKAAHINIDVEDVKIPTIPPLKLYTGGIVNQPGRGVPVSNRAIGGEQGPEGVIPLTNEQAMEELGESIGKHVNITINLTTKMDNKTIAKEQIKYNQKKNFARG